MFAAAVRFLGMMDANFEVGANLLVIGLVSWKIVVLLPNRA